MNILIDIGHPAHVHLFRNFYHVMESRGHTMFVTVKDIPSAKELLTIYNMPFIDLGAKKDSIFGKGLNQLVYDWKLLQLVRKNRIDIGLSSSITIPHISRFSRIVSMVYDDDDDAAEPLFVKFGHPFSDYVFTPDAIRRKTTKNIPYPGYHELAYLHPNRFSPDPAILDELGVKPGEKYFILRFVAFKGHHDLGMSGLTPENKQMLVDLLEPHGKIFITAERQIEPELEKYRIRIAPEKIHSALAYASLFVGDSQTMTSEAAILGTPAVKCNTFAQKLSVPNEIEHRYDMCYSFQPYEFDKVLVKVKDLLAMPDIKSTWNERRNVLFNDKIDVSSFMIRMVEGYPAGIDALKQDPEMMQQFKG